MKNLGELIKQIVGNAELHAKWLNTLSMMENCGARKIAGSEHSHNVDLIVLKHAAEEARHAYYLKSQIRKIAYNGCTTYEPESILAPIQSFQYLPQLDITINRFLKELGYQSENLKYASYLLVTYAIEERADELYPIYERALKESKSNISVRMIIAEEKGHLEEMISQMESFFGDWKALGDFAVQEENRLFESWIQALTRTTSKVQLEQA